ncbi:MAG: thioesterase family protein [bacterium]|jgi:fluoroacetyl-CoA thioesterase
MPTLHAVQPGLTATVQKLVTEADAALHFGSGALKNLFATPVFVALVVEAAVRAADPMLPDGLVTAGVGLDLRHTAPTAIGLTVTVEAVLERIEDSRLFFRFKAYDEVGEIGSGIHERVVVSLKGIMKSAERRQKKVIANMA